MPEDETTVAVCGKEKVIQLAPHTEVKVACGLGEHHTGVENGHPWHVAWQEVVPGETEVMFRWH